MKQFYRRNLFSELFVIIPKLDSGYPSNHYFCLPAKFWVECENEFDFIILYVKVALDISEDEKQQLQTMEDVESRYSL